MNAVGELRVAVVVDESHELTGPASIDATTWRRVLSDALDGDVPARLVVTAGPGEPRGPSLQRAYERARDLGAHHVVVVTAGVLPAHPTWLVDLVERITGGSRLVVVSRSDAASAHSSAHSSGGGVTFLAASVDLLERHRLRFAGRSPLSMLVHEAIRQGLDIDVLPPTNPVALTNHPGAIHGDLVYDHGVSDWARLLGSGEEARQDKLRSVAAELLVDHRREYLEWLRGTQIEDRVYFVVGMHRSGTSLLTSALERCGLHLGATFRTPLPDHPSGNYERSDAIRINDRILRAAGASWQRPPAVALAALPADRAAIREVVGELQDAAPGGLKDPRLLITLEAWLAEVRRPGFVGTFRHPADVARSLRDRDAIPAADAHAMWAAYNDRLVRLHQQVGFPIIEFDTYDPAAYSRLVAVVAAQLGLVPRIHAIADAIAAPHADGRDADEHDADAVPSTCRAAYDYLRANRFDLAATHGGFAEALVRWEALQPPAAPVITGRKVDRVLFTLGRHLPRRLRRLIWRISYLIGGTPTAQPPPPSDDPGNRRP